MRRVFTVCGALLSIQEHSRGDKWASPAHSWSPPLRLSSLRCTCVCQSRLKRSPVRIDIVHEAQFTEGQRKTPNRCRRPLFSDFPIRALWIARWHAVFISALWVWRTAVMLRRGCSTERLYWPCVQTGYRKKQGVSAFTVKLETNTFTSFSPCINTGWNVS